MSGRVGRSTLATAVVVWAVGSTSLAATEIDLHRSDEGAIEFTVHFDAPRFDVIDVDGRTWRTVSIPDTRVSDAVGSPATLTYLAHVGIPADAEITSVRADPVATQTYSGAPLAPVPSPLPHPDDPSRPGGLRYRSGWSGDEPTEPASWAELSGVTWVRTRRVASLAIHPVRTRPGDPRVSVAAAVRVRLVLAPAPGSTARTEPVRYADDPAGAALDSRLVNGPGSRQWLRGARPATRRRGVEPYYSRAPEWVRIVTRDQGVAAVSGADLQAAGVSLAGVDPATVRMFSGVPLELPFDPPPTSGPLPWMQEIAITVADGGDGTLDGGDRIEYYATAVDGFRHHLNPAGGDTAHVLNLYSDRRVHWLTWGGSFDGSPLRMVTEDASPSATEFTLADRVPERLHLEENSHYDDKLRNFSYRWERWWWNSGYRQSDGGARGVFLETPGHVEGTGSTFLTRFWGVSLGHHAVDVRINANPMPTLTWFGRGDPEDAVFTNDVLLDGRNTITFRVDPDTTIRRNDEIVLADFEIWHQRALRWLDGPFRFESLPAGGTIRYRLSDLPDASVEVLDVTDPFTPRRLTSSAITGGSSTTGLEIERTETAGGSRYWVDHPAHRVEVVEIERDTKPLGGVAYLREWTEPVDYLVIYADGFETAAERLRDFREQVFPGRSDARAVAVRLSDVYDEFSFGLIDPTAIRNFIAWAYDHYRDPGLPAVPRLTYVMLLGDADFDHRDYETATNEDILPAWSERYDNTLAGRGWDATWPSDDYMGLLDGPDEFGMDVFVGRFPAETVQQATVMVDKTIAHVDAPARDDWQRKVVLVADDLCQGTAWDSGFATNWTHTRQAEGMLTVLPGDTEPVRVYLSDHPDPVNGIQCLGGDKPSSRDALIDAINDGAWLVDYVGHGGETVMADERVLVSADIPQMQNQNRFHYFVTASCTVGKFDDRGEGLAETILKQPGGGSINSYSAAAVAFSGSNERLNLALLGGMFASRSSEPDSMRSFGEAAAIALLDVPQLNSRKYNNLGDPANRLARPAYDLALTLRDAAGTALVDTVWRGEELRLSGQVIDPATGDPVSIDGEVGIRILDSEEFRHREGPWPPPSGTPVDYFLPGAPMYRGTATVEAGEFDVALVVPTGLRRGERGSARVRAYLTGTGAGSSRLSTDAVGSLDSLAVPDATRPEFVVTDSLGPAIDFAWEAPVEAIPADSDVIIGLEDAQGIYITQLLDSRSVVLTFEDESGFVQSLIDLAPEIWFADGENRVEVAVPIPTSLTADRRYQVRVRASDNLGNRSAVEESIFLVSGAQSGVNRVFAYPNPATTQTGVFVDVSAAVDVTLKLYTVSGKLLRSLTASLAPGEGRSRPLTWDLRDEDGDRVANGSYRYLLAVRPQSGGPVEERRGWVAVLR